MESSKLRKISYECAKQITKLSEKDMKAIDNALSDVYGLDGADTAFGIQYSILVDIEKAISLLKGENKESLDIMCKIRDNAYATIACVLSQLYNAGETEIFEVFKNTKKEEMEIKAF